MSRGSIGVASSVGAQLLEREKGRSGRSRNSEVRESKSREHEFYEKYLEALGFEKVK